MIPTLATWRELLTTWNPVTFYALATVVQSFAIYLGYALLGGDTDHNTWTTALIGAAIGNGAAYGLRHYEPLVGVIGTTLVYLAVLVTFSGVDMFRSIAVFGLVVASYAGLVHGLEPRTDLEIRPLGSIPQAAHQGGLQKAPIDRTPQGDDTDSDLVPHGR